MSAAAHHRGTKAIIRELHKNDREPLFDVFDRLQSIPKSKNAFAPLGKILISEDSRGSSYRDGWDSARSKISFVTAEKFDKWLFSRIKNLTLAISTLKNSKESSYGLTLAKIASLESELSALDTVLQIIDVDKEKNHDQK